MSDSLIHSVAGALGGIVAMSATYPLTVLSMRDAVTVENKDGSTKAKLVGIVKREGIRGLYSGLESSLVAIAITNGVYYYFYELSKGYILRSRQKRALGTLDSILTGAIAGSATTLASNPIWVVQTSQAVNGSATVKDTIRDIIAKDGIRGLWRGIGPALFLVINPILQYTTFEQLKNILIARRTAQMRTLGASNAIAVLSDWDFFILGAISKLVATASTYPYIVIKSRLQAGQEKAMRYKSSLDGILSIIKEEGILGVYKGIGSKVTQSVLTAAILFAMQKRIYEMTHKALRVSI